VRCSPGAEHYQIGYYTSLIDAAEDLGDQETARVCREILPDDQAMADFLFQQIPLATIEMLQMEHAMASR
jgi:ferritin-like metal-binding protein YciE